jgi:hypothetical protein
MIMMNGLAIRIGECSKLERNIRNKLWTAYGRPHDTVSALAGRVNRNVAPWGMSAGAQSRLPWACLIKRQIESPIPTPRDLVVNKALNSRSAFSAEIPTPKTVTLASTRCVSSRPDRIISSRGRSVTDCIA